MDVSWGFMKCKAMASHMECESGMHEMERQELNFSSWVPIHQQENARHASQTGQLSVYCCSLPRPPHLASARCGHSAHSARLIQKEG